MGLEFWEGICCFFFQAEDGIRDYKVTGVQTCALPIYWFRKDWFDRPDLKAKFKEKYGYELGVPKNWSAYEIGRASCRERV